MAHPRRRAPDESRGCHRRHRAHRHVPGAAAGPRRPRGDRDEPRPARPVPRQPTVGRGQPGHRGPGRRGRGGHVRRPGRGAAPGCGHRPGLLHRGRGPATGRQSPPGPAAAAALRHDLGARPGAAGAGDRGRAAHRLRRVRRGQGGDRGAAAPRDAVRRGARRGAAPRAHQRPGLAGHHPGRQPRPGRVDLPGHRQAAGAARPRPGRAAPRARRRRGPGVRAGADPARRHRGQLPRGGRAGHDAARAGRGGGPVVRPGTGAGLRGLAGVRAAGRRRARRGHPGAHLPQHHGQHRPGPADAGLRAPVQHPPGAARGAGLAGRERAGGRRRRAAAISVQVRVAGW